MTLSKKTAVVTGGSRGIGRAIVYELARQGANVIFTYKENMDLANQVVLDISEKNQLATCIQLDVSLRDNVNAFASQIQETYGSIDILVNNAGVNKPNDFDKIQDSDWDWVMDTNLKSVFMMGQAFLPVINTKGSIINISSVSGQYGGPRTTHYCVSKAGINALTQNMAIFFADKKIRVNAVSPGLIQSEMANAAANLGVEEKILLKRQGKTSEVAHVVAFLASDNASYITAQTINVNGGLYF